MLRETQDIFERRKSVRKVAEEGLIRNRTNVDLDWRWAVVDSSCHLAEKEGFLDTKLLRIKIEAYRHPIEGIFANQSIVYCCIHLKVLVIVVKRGHDAGVGITWGSTLS